MNWLFWLLAGGLTAAVVALLLRPLMSAGTGLGRRSDYDIAVYKDQLAEVDRDLERGVISPAEAATARTEIGRRLLAADARDSQDMKGGQDLKETQAAKGGNGWAALLLAGLVPLATMALYVWLGNPGLPSLPFAERQGEREQGQDIAQLADQLAARMQAEPSDPRGWELLARTAAQLGRFEQAAQAFRQAIERGGPRADLSAGLGEAMTASAQGNVTPQARAAFEEALRLDPSEPRARYYMGVASIQSGDARGAIDIWSALARETPPEVPWRAALVEQIVAVARETGIEPGDLTARVGPATQPGLLPGAPPSTAAPALPRIGAAPPGPSPAEVEAAREMTPEAQQAFIRSMVDRLASRLKDQPDDLDGWLRLARAQSVLGEREAAIAALRRAEGLTAGLPDSDPRRQTVSEGLRALGVAAD